MGKGSQIRLTRRALLAQGMATLATAAAAEPPLAALRPEARPGTGPPGRPDKRPRARPGPETFVTDARLGGNVAFVLADAESGRVLQSRQAATPLPPASVVKSLTALYALDVLGPDHRFRTRIMTTEPVVDGITEGDLILAGGGDPVLDTDGLAELAARLKAAGLREVRGRFLVWGGALPELDQIDPTQMAHLGYNPSISGLNLNFNRVHFQWRREGDDYAVTMDARSATLRPEVQVARMRIVDREGPVYTYEDGGDFDDWTVARWALGGDGARWLPVRRPALYAGEVFRTLARSHGIVLDAPEHVTDRPEGAEIAGLDSLPLSEIVRDMLRYSTNLTAETIGLAATAARGVAPAELAASAAIMGDWLALTFGAAPELVDHSGLGDTSRITAADMVRILTSETARSRLPALLKPLTLRDAEGRPLNDPPAEILAKTGTLYFVSCLSGYLRGRSGQDLAFTILTANLDRREALAGSLDERPPGAAAWTGRSRWMQQRLLQHWSVVGRDGPNQTPGAGRVSSSDAGDGVLPSPAGIGR